MLTIPPALAKKYDRLLVNSGIPPNEYPACRKWLRFYLDFCKKYEHGYADSESLILFIEKLNSKNQNSFQQNQAKKAVRLYYSGIDKKTPLSVSVSAKENPAPACLFMEGPGSLGVAEENNPWEVSIDNQKLLKEQQPIHSGTVLPVICFRQIMTSERFRNFWDIAMLEQL